MNVTSVCLQDTLCTADLQTTAAARILEGYTPSHDATSVALLKAAGGIIVGKCNCDAFAMGSTNESSDYKVRSCPAERLTYCCRHLKT